MRTRSGWVLFLSLGVSTLLFLVPLQLYATAASPTLEVDRVSDEPPGVTVRVLTPADESALPAPLRAALEGAAAHGSASVAIDPLSQSALERLGAAPGQALLILFRDGSFLAKLVPTHAGALDAARDAASWVSRRVGV